MATNRRHNQHEPRRRRRSGLWLCLAIGMAAVGAMISGGSAIVASPRAADEPTHFYSTAGPPASFEGPVPDSAPEQVAESPIPPVDPAVDRASAIEPTITPAPIPDVEGSTEPADEPSATPMRLAAADAADRVPEATHPSPPTGTSAIEAAKAMMDECKARFGEINDYTCTFMKRERIGGVLSGYHIMAMKARTRPDSFYFKFRQPNAGREAIFVRGKHQGKAIVHDVGLGKFLAGTLHLDPRSNRAMDGNRHPITDAGIGHMIQTLVDAWNRELDPGNSVVQIREQVLVNKRPCTLIVSTHPRPDRRFLYHQVRVYIDREHGLPIRFEAYDWPRRSGEAAPLLEEYTYADLRIDVGLTDRDFDPSNKAYGFGRF